jgi:uncharacterized protein (TIGR01777 family)
MLQRIGQAPKDMDAGILIGTSRRRGPAQMGETGPMKVAVTGSHGLIGSALVGALASAGHDPLRLVRSQPRGPDEIRWDPEGGDVDSASLEGIDAAVHLAGQTIGRPWWTPRHKARVMDSRVRGTRLLAETVAGLDKKPAVLVSGSAVGFYGDRGNEVLTEDSGPGSGFLASVVRAWEESAEPARGAGIRVAHIRTGIVLSERGGALGPLLIPIRLGVGGPLGSGRQYWPWITLDDHVAAILHVLTTEEVTGPVNLVGPHPAPCGDIVRTLGRVLRRPTLLPVPTFALKVVVGPDMAKDLILASQRVVPKRLEESGFKFRFPELEGAVRHVFRRPA